MKIYLILFGLIFHETHSLKILGLFQVQYYSHQKLCHMLTRELAAKGHEMTIFTTHKMNLEGVSNITQHHFNESVAISDSYPDMMEYKTQKINDFIFYTFYQLRTYYEVSKNQIQHPELQQLIKKKEKFDLILMECLFCPLTVLGEVFDSPIVFISPSELGSLAHKTLGNDIDPSRFSDLFLPYPDDSLSFLEKVHSWCVNVPYMEMIIEPIGRFLFRNIVETYIGDIDLALGKF